MRCPSTGFNGQSARRKMFFAAGKSIPAPESNPSEFGELDAPGLLSGPLYTQRGRIGKTETVVQALSTG
ncbi:hypothetical protein [Acetobacter persici]|nr:hypothetical protein [Acetobacter persici]